MQNFTIYSMIAGLAGRIVMKIVDWILNKEKTRLCLQGATYANLSLLKELFRNGHNTSINFLFSTLEHNIVLIRMTRYIFKNGAENIKVRHVIYFDMPR